MSKLTAAPPVLPSQPSKAAVLLGAFSLPTYGLYAAYVALGIVVALLYSWSMNLRNPDSALGWFSSTPRHPWHGNERLWFLVLGNTLFFWSLAVRDVLKVTFLPKWPRALVRFPVAVRSSLVACFTTYSGPISFVGDASLALTFTLAYSFVYFATRRTTWSWAMTYVPVLRPFIINFVKRSNLTWSMAWHLLVLQLTALLALKPALAVLNDYITQPLHFASFTSRSPLTPDRYLLTALETKNAFYLDHTIMELQRAVHSPARRAAIFADSSNPTLVHELFAALLLQLGNVHATLTSRGAAQGPSTPKPAPKPAAPDAHSMALKTADIFRPAPKKTGLQQIVGHVLEGTPQPTPAPVVAIAASASRAEAEVRRRVEEPAHAIERWAAGTPVLGPIVGAVTLARGGFARWAAGEWTRRRVFAAVPEQDRLERLVDSE